MKEIFTGNSVINQFIQIIPITLLVGLLYIIFRFLKLKKSNGDINYKKESLYLIFVWYIYNVRGGSCVKVIKCYCVA